MSEYLELDSTRLSYREYWRWKPGLPFLLLVAAKLTGWRMARQLVVPSEPAVDIVAPDQQPPELVGALGDAIAACESTGRKLVFWYTVPVISPNLGLGAALTGPDGLSVAMAVVAQPRAGGRSDVVLGLVSRLQKGGFLSTGPGKSLVDPPPEVEAMRLPGRSYEELVGAHDRQVAARGGGVVACGDVRQLILELQALQTRANVTRGVYVPAASERVERLRELWGERRRTRG